MALQPSDGAPGPLPRTRARRVATLVTLVGAAVLLLPGLGDGSLQGDEAIYGAIALDSARAGAPLGLELDGRPYVNKPPLLFWAMEATFALLGPSPLSARLPGALAGILLALWIQAEGCRRYGVGWGTVAALLALSTPTALGLAGDRGFRTVCTDSLLALAVALAVGSWIRWSAAGARGVALRPAVAVSAGALAKGYLAPLHLALAALAGAGTGSGAPARRGVRWLGLVTAVAAGLATTAIWILALDRSGAPRVWERVVLRNTVDRVSGGVDPAHLQGPLYYCGTIARDFGPWLLLALPALLALRRRAPEESAATRQARRVDFLLPLLAVAFFSLAATKLRWYLLPVYPFLALSLAAGGARISRQVTSRVLRVALPGVLALLLVVRVGVAVRELRIRPAPPMAPLVTLLETEATARFERLFVDPEMGFGAPAGGLTAEEYFHLGTRPEVMRALPPSPPVAVGCAGVLAASEARARSMLPGATVDVRRVERARPDVGPLWLARSCAPFS